MTYRGVMNYTTISRVLQCECGSLTVKAKAMMIAFSLPIPLTTAIRAPSLCRVRYCSNMIDEQLTLVLQTSDGK
jgi:hypothetical protein